MVTQHVQTFSFCTFQYPEGRCSCNIVLRSPIIAQFSVWSSTLLQCCIQESGHCTLGVQELNFFFNLQVCDVTILTNTHAHTHTHTHKCTCMHAHKSPHTHTLVIMHTIISHTPLHTQICTTHTHTHTLQLIYGLCIGVVSLFSHFWHFTL